MEKKLKIKERSKDKFLSLISAFQKSDLSQKAFCKKHEVAYSTFQYYLRRFRNEGITSSSFVEIIASKKASNAATLEILFPTGAKVICNSQSDISLIRSLIL
jgi:hypothetical protein